MIRCVMDTSNRFLTVALFQDEVLLFYIYKESFKTQSEHMIEVLNEVFQKCSLKPTDLNECVVSIGPGSYTGVRIALTVAKTLFASANIPIYTTTSLQLMAGKSKDAFVMIDARSNRVYGAFVSNGKLVSDPAIYTIDQLTPLLENFKGDLFGDLRMIGQEDNYGNIEDGLSMVNQQAQLCLHPHVLTPLYLKSLQDYQQ